MTQDSEYSETKAEPADSAPWWGIAICSNAISFVALAVGFTSVQYAKKYFPSDYAEFPAALGSICVFIGRVIAVAGFVIAVSCLNRKTVSKGLLYIYFASAAALALFWWIRHSAS
ncbi:Uncharacterised protein [Mycobacteroides abscessus subsp. abscessus]|nr:Uncharacterised protein [Mycobacteroides abscessus subsp. abscessus]